MLYEVITVYHLLYRKTPLPVIPNERDKESFGIHPSVENPLENWYSEIRVPTECSAGKCPESQETGNMEDTTLPFSSPADFKPLRTLDEYSLYFNELRLAFEKLQEAFIRRARQQPGTSSPKTPTPAWQLRNAEATYETGAVSFFLSSYNFV